MAFFEIPTWCLDSKDIKDHVYCDSDTYPNSGLPKLPKFASAALEIFWLGVLLFFTFFRRMFKIPSYFSKVREVVQTVLTIIAFIDILVAIAIGKGVIVSKFVRLLLIILFIRSLRESLIRIVLVVYDSKEILMLLVAYIWFFGWIGNRLFKGTQEGEVYFRTLTESMWNLLILLTTANFPDIMLPAYQTHKAYWLFFILYLIIGLFFMLNLILAIYYSNYKNRVEESINSFISHREEHLMTKFKEYDLQNKGYLTSEQCKNLVWELLKLDKKSKKSINVQRVANIFDEKCHGKITGKDFLNYFDLMDILQLKSQDTTIFKTKHSKYRQLVKKIVKNPFYECAVYIFICLNFSLIFCWDYMDTYGSDRTTALTWVYTQLAINMLFLVEMLTFFYAYGIIYSLKSRSHIMLELAIQVIYFIVFIDFLAYSNVNYEIKAIEITVIGKL